MTWYKVIFRQLQPIHVGQGRFGVLGQTRIFIPGWTMWGALTKAFNIKQGVSLENNQDLFETITNVFPTFDPEGNLDNILFPHYQDGYFFLGEYREDHFRAEFCEVFMSTAVRPISRQAKDASLHELEFILPKGKTEKQQLYWVGWIELENKDDIPKEIYVGGDRRYGFGLLELHGESKQEDYPNVKSIWFVQYNLAKDNIEQGKLELIPEFEFFKGEVVNNEKNNFRFNAEVTDYFWIPGSEIKKTDMLNNSKLKKGKLVL